MRILVGYASRYGSTEQIAERIAADLRRPGFAVDLRPLREVADTKVYDAFVIGSAVYIGAWLKEATDFVDQQRMNLSTRPLWLFSSGPLGVVTDDAQASEVRTRAVNAKVAALKDELGAREHHVFYGALERDRLHFGDKLIASMPVFPGSFGDFRNWSEIDAWAAQIADALSTAASGERAPVTVGR
jgi:menaquinone-dependent protoporphyrinogen oxidase